MMFHLEVENSWKNMPVLEEVCENNDQRQKGLLGEGRGGAYLPVFNISMFFFPPGLRGAVAFALVLHLQLDDEKRHVLITSTLIIIMFTILCLGGSTLPLLKVTRVSWLLQIVTTKCWWLILILDQRVFSDSFTKISEGVYFVFHLPFKNMVSVWRRIYPSIIGNYITNRITTIPYSVHPENKS